MHSIASCSDTLSDKSVEYADRKEDWRTVVYFFDITTPTLYEMTFESRSISLQKSCVVDEHLQKEIGTTGRLSVAVLNTKLIGPDNHMLDFIGSGILAEFDIRSRMGMQAGLTLCQCPKVSTGVTPGIALGARNSAKHIRKERFERRERGTDDTRVGLNARPDGRRLVVPCLRH